MKMIKVTQLFKGGSETKEVPIWLNPDYFDEMRHDEDSTCIERVGLDTLWVKETPEQVAALISGKTEVTLPEVGSSEDGVVYGSFRTYPNIGEVGTDPNLPALEAGSRQATEFSHGTWDLFKGDGSPASVRAVKTKAEAIRWVRDGVLPND